jgi:hypothetical protein
MGTPGPKPRDPAPAEIVRMCQSIRADWSEREYRRRSGWPVELADHWDEWTVPVYFVRDLDLPRDVDL